MWVLHPRFLFELYLSTSLDFSFYRLKEMSTKEIKVKYAAFTTSLSILTGTIDTKFNMNPYWSEKREMQVLLLHFPCKTWLGRTTTCKFFRHCHRLSIKELRLRYARLMTLLPYLRILSLWIEIVKKKKKWMFCFCNFNAKSKLNKSLVFSFPDTFRDKN